MKKIISIVMITFILTLYTDVNARNFRVNQIPNGGKFSCNTCHTSGGGSF